MSFNCAIFQNPPSQYRTLPFWSWNETLQPEEVKRQVRLFKDGGLGGGFLHARVGLLSPYLGEEWFAACRAAVDQLRESGLHAWLYDEDSWPSGFSGGGVPKADATYRHQALFARPAGVPVPENSVPVGETVNGLQIYRWTASLGEARFNGTCYADLMSADAMREFISQAYDSYFERLGPHYGNTVIAEFTDEPCALLHYRIPAGAVPFSPALFETFEALHGYDPRPQLHLLFTEQPAAARFRLHYYRVVSHLFEHNFTKQLADWCEAHGIALTGHYYREDSLYEQQAAGNAIMPNFRHQHIPGIDHLFLQATEIITAKQCQSVVNQYSKPRMMCEMYAGCGQGMTFEDRLWIACHLMVMGVNMVTSHLCLYSMSGSRKRDYPPNLGYQQPWFEVNEAIDVPLARLCAALAQGKYVADVLVLHPLESLAALWCARTDWEDSAALNGSSQVTSPAIKEQVQTLETNLDAVMRSLLAAQRGFDLGDETILAEAGAVHEVAGQASFQVGAMDYAVVVLPALVTISNPVFKLLQKFAATGGTILRCGDAPSLLDGEPSEALQAFIKGLAFVPAPQLDTALAAIHPPCVHLSFSEYSEPLIRSHVRDLPGGDRLVFLFDARRTGEAVDVQCQLGGDYSHIYRLDPFSGTETLLDVDAPQMHPGEKNELALELSFNPTEFYLLRLARGEASSVLAASKSPEASTSSAEPVEIPLEHWTVTRLDDNALPLDTLCWREARFPAFTTYPIPVIALQQRLNDLCYVGPLSLRYSFEVGELFAGRKVHLVVEYPERYRITINEVEVQYTGLPPYRDIRFLPIDVTPLVRSGANFVELTLDKFRYAEPSSQEDHAARYGTEIEAIYLVGDFHVQANLVEEEPAQVTQTETIEGHVSGPLPPIKLSYLEAKSLFLCDPRPLQPGDVTVQGLPFYAGRLEMTTDLNGFENAPSGSGNAVLRVERLNAVVARLKVDGEPHGSFISNPYRLELPASAQRLSIVLYSSLRNLLGPHHHADGDPINVRPWYFQPYCGDLSDRPENILKWGEAAFHSPNHRDSYACVGFGNVGRITIATTPATSQS